MKKIKIMLLILTLGFSGSLLAGGIEGNFENPTALSTEISKIMKRHYISLEEEMVVHVKFTFNEYGEIVVLSVGCVKPEIRSFVANSLNNKKLQKINYEQGRVYKLPLRLIP